jgi:hypothetical protein
MFLTRHPVVIATANRPISSFDFYAFDPAHPVESRVIENRIGHGYPGSKTEA